MEITTPKRHFVHESEKLSAREIPGLLAMARHQQKNIWRGFLRVKAIRIAGDEPVFIITSSLITGGSQLLHLQSSATNFGGRRWWYVCPRCEKRYTALYWSVTGFRCRKCLGLRYACQYEYYENEFHRQCRRIQRARIAIWGTDDPDVTFLMRSPSSFKRPKGMRRNTFRRKLERLHELEWRWHGVAMDHFNAWKKG